MFSENPIIQTEAVFADALCRLYQFAGCESTAQVTAWHLPIFHSHSFFEILFSGDRGYRVIFREETVLLPPHSIYIVPAGVQHCAADTMGLGDISVGFSIEPFKGGSPAVFKQLSNQLLLCLKMPKPVAPDTEACFRDFYRCGDDSMQDIFRKKVLAHRLVYGVLQDLQILNDDPKIVGPKHANLAASIEALMDRRKYHLEEIAQILGYTPKYTALLIKKQYGCDFRDLRRQKILEAAKIYLSSRNLSVAEIAQLLGYRSESAFYAFFKEETGVTPSAYRKKILSKEEEIPYESQ